jgi:hypothetical protein
MNILRTANVLIIALLFAAASSQAQTAASCTFTYFNTPSPYNLSAQPGGINHYNTVVGMASSSSKWVGFIRYSGGSIKLFSVPNSQATILTRRNVYGTTVGYYNTGTGSTSPSAGLILTSSSFATVKYPGAISTFLTGINKSNTIVGSYERSDQTLRGLIYQNGKFTTINFPGAYSTTIAAINDSGTIIGSYIDGNFENPTHAFMLKNGVYKSSVGGTDINNSGTMVGGDTITYSNGTSKTVHAPGSFETFVYGINDLGVITGDANYPSSNGNYTWKNFTAVCK